MKPAHPFRLAEEQSYRRRGSVDNNRAWVAKTLYVPTVDGVWGSDWEYAADEDFDWTGVRVLW